VEDISPVRNQSDGWRSVGWQSVGLHAVRRITPWDCTSVEGISSVGLHSVGCTSVEGHHFRGGFTPSRDITSVGTPLRGWHVREGYHSVRGKSARRGRAPRE